MIINKEEQIRVEYFVHYPSGRAFRSNLLRNAKGFPLQSLMLKAFPFYKLYLSYEKQVKWRSFFLVSKRSCQPNTAAQYFYLFFNAYQAAILPYGFFQKPVMPFAVPSSVVTAALSLLQAALFFSLVPRYFLFSSLQSSRCYSQARLRCRFGCGFVIIFAQANSPTLTQKNYAKPLCDTQVVRVLRTISASRLSSTRSRLATHGLQLPCIPFSHRTLKAVLPAVVLSNI